MALEYLEIKEFPSDLMPILRGAGEVVSWWRNGELAARKHDALLVAGNAGMYGLGVGADWFGPPLIGAAASDSENEIASQLEAKIAEAAPTKDGKVKAVNPLLVLQIAQLIYQLIKSLKS